MELIHVVLERAVAAVSTLRVSELSTSSPTVVSATPGVTTTSATTSEPTHSPHTTADATSSGLIVKSTASRSTATSASPTTTASTGSGLTVAVSMTYADSVLKQLPELKTLVNLRQSLYQRLVSGTSVSSLELAKTSGGDSLSQQHRLNNAGAWTYIVLNSVQMYVSSMRLYASKGTQFNKTQSNPFSKKKGLLWYV